ncbi:MAG: U32 family peptidase [Clostridia bacterium]|nr:U32 family peptidase [Clostridia bacterium]
MTELLSPVGNREALEAALQSGADAVYLGLTEFSARAGADNFDNEALEAALRLCHRQNVKVFVTLNTLIRDRECERMAEAIRFLAKIGVDGIIVQDLATAALAKSIAPDLPLHGSTQMCIYSLDGAKALEKLGFTRVVLARELSLEEIRHIARGTDLEIEVFVHGALCMCYSGHCYFSAVVGRNSGNRGRCAQPCRLPYEGGYPLSLKDLSLIEYVQQLQQAGVDSFKIEGRLKSPLYVGAVTAAFADALRGKAPDKSVMQQLGDIFSRDGFTDGYFKGQTGAHMFGTKKKTEYASYRAAALEAQQRKPYKRFCLNITLTASENVPSQWQADDGTNTVTFTGDTVSAAQNKPLTEQSLRERLDKLTDTHYTLGECKLYAQSDIFLPVGAINAARRQACELLDTAREKSRPYPLTDERPDTLPPCKTDGGQQILYHSINAFSPGTDHTPFAAVWLPAEQAHLYSGANRGAHVDHFYPSDKLPSLIASLKEKDIPRVLVGNIGHIAPFKEAGFEVWGDYGLNITNSLSLSEYTRLGLKNACLSFELALPQIRDIRRPLATTLIVYGRLPLMQFKNCVISQTSRCLNHRGFGTLSDRKGMTFLLSCRPGCGNTLFNSLPLWLDAKQLQGFDDVDKRFDFTDESPAEVQTILQLYADGRTPDGSYTKGLYTRGVI